MKDQDKDSKDNNSEYLRRAEDALEASELRYRRLFESAQDGILILDFDTGQILDVNPYLIDMLGYSHAEYLGRKLWEIGPFKDAAASKTLFRELQEQGYVRYEDLPLETGDGRSIEVEFVSNSYPVNGKKFIQCNIRDITARRQAENLVRVRLSLLEYSATHSLDELLQKTLDEVGSLTNSSIGFYHFISEDEKIISLQAWSTRTVTEFCKAEGKGQHYPVDQAGVWVDCVRERRPVIHNDYSAPPHRKGMPEGHAAVIRELVVPIIRSNRIVAVLGIGNKPTDYAEKDVELVSYLADVAWEITRRKRAEESLTAANMEWERTFDAISDLVMVLDDQHKILRVNKAMADALGMTEQEAIGKLCFELVHGDKEPPAFCPHSQLLNDGEEHSAEVVEPRLGGIYDVRVSPLVGQDGQVIGSVHITRDITARKKMEEALSQSESMLRGVLQAAPIGIGVVSDRIFKWTNEFLFQITGYAQAELTGQSARILYENDEEFERVGEVKYAQISETGTGTVETRWKRKDGTIIDIILSSTAIDPQNPSAGVVFTALDVTERKQAQQALRESEERYRAVFDNAGIGIDMVDRDGKVVGVNPALSDMLGYTEEDFRQLTLMDITHPDDREISKRSLDGILSGEVASYRVEKRYIRKDGGVLWGDLSVSAIQDAEGKHTATVGVIADITERKESQVKLKQSEERLRLIIDSSPIGIIIVQEGKYVYVNPRFVEIFGYEKADEILGLPVEAIYVPESKELIVQRVPDSTSGTKTISHYEAVGVSKSGKAIDAGAWVTEIEYLGGEASLAFVMDVTESKRLRSQLLQAQKMESIGTLAGGIAHDFNNLLTVVLGFSELLLIGKDEQDPSYADLQRINHAARNGADLVRRILTFSRKAEFNPRPLNLNHEIEQAKQLLTRTVPKMIEVELVLSDGLPTVIADPTQVEQVLMNLAVNARDAMPEGGKLTIDTKPVTLDEEYCRLHLGSKPGDYVMLSISDTGHGMDSETLNHIFEPFYTTKASGEGTGLGLAMVYGMVKQCGGYIIGYSEPGMGTAFRIYLPVIPTEAKSEPPTDKPILSRGTETILLVDDEEMVRDLGKRILERSGYTVLTAANGKEAVNLYRKQGSKISLVILDLIMPEMGGRQCLEELLKIDSQVNVLIASGYSAAGETKKTIESGARGYVGKPYEMRGLLEAVRRVLDA